MEFVETDDYNGYLPCPFCGNKETGTFEISEGDHACCACGGVMEIEREVVYTVRARPKTPPTGFDLELFKSVTPEKFETYAELRGWEKKPCRDAALVLDYWSHPKHDRVFYTSKRLSPSCLKLGLDVMAEVETRSFNEVLQDMAQ